RVWDEAMLDAIRRDLPAPTTHARNLFHVSAAMWDAWAAYDPKADGYFVTEKDAAPDVEAAREAAISYAAYRVLLWRYSYGANIRVTFDELARTMGSLCYRLDYTSTKGDSPAALGAGPADRSRPPADRDTRGGGVQAGGGRRHPEERGAGSRRQPDDRHRTGRIGGQPARNQRRSWLHGESVDGSALYARACSP